MNQPVDLSSFEIAYGSVVGKDHISSGKVLVGKNNQDAIAIRRNQDVIVAVVCDGCGSGAHSELGAIWGANNIAQNLVDMYSLATIAGHIKFMEDGCTDAPPVQPIRPSQLVEIARQNIVHDLRTFAATMAPPDALAHFVNDYLLFSCMCVIVTKHHAEIFAIGDGYYAFDAGLGVQKNAIKFPKNAPPYLAYELITNALSRSYSLRFELLQSFFADEVKFVLIGSDGVADLADISDRLIPGKTKNVGDLSQFWVEDRYFTNQSMVGRTLRLLNSEAQMLQDGVRTVMPRLLPDDTSLITIRRKIGS